MEPHTRTLLGPYLSERLPVTSAKIAYKIIYNDWDPDIEALDAPKLSAMGLIYNPKDIRVPNIRSSRIKPTPTRTHPW